MYILDIQFFLKEIILGRKRDYYCVSKSDDHRFSILIVSHCASYILPTADHYLYVKVKMRNFLINSKFKHIKLNEKYLWVFIFQKY